MSNSRSELRGKIANVNFDKGYGFIRQQCPACGRMPHHGEGENACKCGQALRDYRFFFSDVLGGVTIRGKGRWFHPQVRFELGEREQGIQAVNVRIVEPTV